MEQLQPKPGYLRLFRAIVTDVWRAAQKSILNLRQAVETRIQGLKAQEDQLERRFIFEQSIDKTTYQSQRDRIRAELTVAKLELGDACLDELEVEGVLAFAESVLGNLAAVWVQAKPDDRRRLQDAVFPSGMVWGRRGIWNRRNHACFQLVTRDFWAGC